MKQLLTVLTLLFTLSVQAQKTDFHSLNPVYSQKLSENSYTLIKDHSMTYIKTSLHGMSQLTINMETGLIQHIKTVGDSVIESERWMDFNKLDSMNFDLFATPQVLLESEINSFNKRLCNAEAQALIDAMEALESAIASGNENLIVHAEALYFAAASNYHQCLTRPVTHEK